MDARRFAWDLDTRDRLFVREVSGDRVQVEDEDGFVYWRSSTGLTQDVRDLDEEGTR